MSSVHNGQPWLHRWATGPLLPSGGVPCLEGVSPGLWDCSCLHFPWNAASVEISPSVSLPFQGLSHKRLRTNQLGAVAQAENSKASVQASETNESASEISSVSICSPLTLKKENIYIIYIYKNSVMALSRVILLIKRISLPSRWRWQEPFLSLRTMPEKATVRDTEDWNKWLLSHHPHLPATRLWPRHRC